MFARLVLFSIVLSCLFVALGSNVRNFWSVTPKPQPALLCSWNRHFSFFEPEESKEPKVKRKYSKMYNKASLHTEPNAFTTRRGVRKPVDFKLFGIF